jgi:hypothetical protein
MYPDDAVRAMSDGAHSLFDPLPALELDRLVVIVLSGQL